MATYEETEQALHRLAAALGGLDADVRKKRVPSRSVSFTVPDLDTTWRGQLDEQGLHDLTAGPSGSGGKAQLRVQAPSDEVVALADSPKDFVTAWMRGRISVKASPLDLLELRRLF